MNGLMIVVRVEKRNRCEWLNLLILSDMKDEFVFDNKTITSISDILDTLHSHKDIRSLSLNNCKLPSLDHFPTLLKLQKVRTFSCLAFLLAGSHG